MAFYSLLQNMHGPNGWDDNCEICVETRSGEMYPRGPVTTRERSRGRHDPGDGPYVNRIAIGGMTKLHVPGSSKEYVLQGSRFNIYSDGERMWDDWSNLTYCYLSVSDRQPSGWGYSLTVYAYRYDSWGWLNRKSVTFHDYGFTESEAERLGLQRLNQWRGIGYNALPGSPTYLSDKRLTGAVVEVKPKLSSQYHGPLDTLDADYVDRRIETGLASAFVDACDKLPSATGMNNIANVADVISSLKSMSKGLTKLGSAADAWLSYRYSYSTTKSDIITLSEFANRIAALPSSIRSNGYFRDGEWEYRVAINVSSPYLASLVSFGEKWGLALDAVNAWDLIPYSFIVDWFIPVSKQLETWQSQSFAMQIQRTSWCSVRHEYVNEYGFKEIDYSRFLYEPQARFASVSRTAYGQKTSTIVKRALDVLALFAK